VAQARSLVFISDLIRTPLRGKGPPVNPTKPFPGWLGAQDENGTRKLENAEDFVRIEIESALKLGKRIIPVLIQDVGMPRAEQLPEKLKPLVRRQAIRLTHERFKADARAS